MNNLAQKYNRFLINIFTIAPFAAYFTYEFLGIDFTTTIQLFTFIGVFLIFFFSGKDRPLKIPTYLIFYLLFILFEFYSTFIQLDREFQIKYLFSNRLIGAFNIMLIIENLIISKKHYYTILKISKNMLIVAFLIILVQQVVDPNFLVLKDLVTDSFSENENRLYSIYSYLTYFTIGFGFVPIFILIVEELDKRNRKILPWILIGIIFAILSKARWVMLNTVFVFLILLINHKDRVKQFLKYLFILPFILIISFILLEGIGINAKGIVEDRILEKDKSSLDQTSAGTRILAFQVFGKLFLDHPLLGVGPVKYGMGGTGEQDYKLRSLLKGRSSQIHVGYLSVLYMFGVLGASFLFLFMYFLYKRLYVNAKKTGVWAPFIGMLGFAVANLTLVTFSVFEMGFIIALVADQYYRQRVNENGLYA